MKTPNFFIVGAPKCGTTAMDNYLGQHPEIYMAYAKESHHFATDLLLPHRLSCSRDWYLAMFQNVKDEKAIGESSVFYLYSRAAARNIYNFNPQSKIIVQIRNPVEWVQSYHAQLIYNDEENILNLTEALAIEAERKKGNFYPKKMGLKGKLFYRDVARFSEQIERYFDIFGRDSVYIIVFDDFKTNLPGVYRETLAFLEIDPNFQANLRIINAHRTVRSQALLTFIRRQRVFWVRGWYYIHVPLTVRIWLAKAYRYIEEFNRKYKPRPPLDPELKSRLQIEFLPEVERLSRLLDRDLTYWCTDD